MRRPQNLVMTVKLRFSEKATENKPTWFWHLLSYVNTKWDIFFSLRPSLNILISKLKGRFHQILWPSQKTWTLAQVVVQIKVATYSYFVQNDKQPQLKSRRCSALFFNPDNVSYACQYKENEVAIKQRAIFFLPSSLTGEKWIKMGVLRRALFPGVDYTVWVYLLPTYILLGTVGGYVRLRQGNLRYGRSGRHKKPYSFTKTKYLKEIGI